MRQRRMTPKEALSLADRAETITDKEARDAYYVLMINAPFWAFSENMKDIRW
jgi:hypothetical protein